MAKRRTSKATERVKGSTIKVPAYWRKPRKKRKKPGAAKRRPKQGKLV